METPAASNYNYSPTVRINYETHGTATRPLILLHGFGASLESWRDIQPLLSTDYRLYLLDLKGFGLSSRPRDNAYSIADQADIVRAFVVAHDLKDAVIVGHSYGGSVALLTYLSLLDHQAADRVSSLVLIDAPAYKQKLPFFVAALRRPVLNRLVLNLVPARTRAAHVLRRLFYDVGKVTDSRVHRYAKYFDLPGSHYSFIEAARQVVPPEPAAVSSRLQEVAVPTLILWGDHDEAVPLSSGKRLQSELPNATLHVVAEAGHIPHEEQPGIVAQHLIKFLK